jgi:hypothetical protein
MSAESCRLCSIPASASAYEPQPLADVTQPLTLPMNPAEVIKINDAYRRPDVADGFESDLWSLDRVAPMVQSCAYGYPVVTYTPPTWTKSRIVSQDEYNEAFAQQFPIVAAMLPIENVIVAGGAAGWPLCPSTGGDVDLFIHGIDPADDAGLWRKLDEIQHRMVAAIKSPRTARYRVIVQVMTPGVLTVTFEGNGSDGNPPVLKVQVILRAYKSVSAILHAFDIPAACVAYDGKFTWLTSLGAYAHVHRVNIVEPRYRSTTYEVRLKKYFGRGFALALPWISRETLVKAQTTKLPFMDLHVYTTLGNFICGDIILPDGLPMSDYEPTNLSESGAAWGCESINIRKLAMGNTRWVMGRVAEPEYDGMHQYHNMLDFRSGSPKFKDLLSREQFQEKLKYTVGGLVDPGTGRIGIGVLRSLFGFSDAELMKFINAVHALFKKERTTKIDISKAMAPHVERLTRKYDQVPQAIEWWIKADPGRQYTASLNPAIATPAEWYGAAHSAEPRAPESEATILALLSMLEDIRGSRVTMSRMQYSNDCAICHCVVTDSVNTVTLPCGHTFHFGQGHDGCMGLYGWINSNKGNKCPMCRESFIYGETKQEKRAPPVLSLD